MRLLRRTLLCLVVGVTAFGAAGWGLRPRASWSVAVPGRFHQIIDPVHELSDDDPVWIGGFEDGYVAVRSKDGALLLATGPLDRTVAVADSRALPGGLLAVDPTMNVRDSSRRFLLFGLDSPTPIASRTLSKDWNLADDWRHAWRVVSDGARRVFECQDLVVDRVVRRLKLPNEFRGVRDGLFDYSAENGALAISESLIDGKTAPFGIQIHDDATGAIVETLPCPPEKLDGFKYLFFVPGGRRLFVALSPGTLRELPATVELGGGTPRYPTREDLPLDYGESGALQLIADRRGRHCWTLNRTDPPTAWVTLQASGASSFDWHAVPATVITQLAPVSAAVPWRRASGAYARPVPGKNEVVVQTIEESLSASVPESFARFVPATWTDRQRAARYRWHDWQTGEWRVATCSDFVVDARPWPTSLMTLSIPRSGPPLLEAWPLPPRDPKPPALAIAALCMAGTWWVCARRYKRRLHIDSPGAG